MRRTLICVLGYGNRAPDIERLRYLADVPESAGLLVFWNTPSMEVDSTLSELSTTSSRVQVRTSSENLGSAGGYSRLLEWANAEPAWEYLLLLDDDLVLQSHALSRLTEHASRRSHCDRDTLYLAYRSNLPELFALVENGKPLVNIRPGTCLGFHVLNLLGTSAKHSSHADNQGIRIDSAPYGGLLIPRPTMQRLGMPMQSLFLYADDTELTLRFTKNGGTIRLIPDAIIFDRSPSWNATVSKGGNLMRRILHLDNTKAYFEARNRNYLSRRFYPGHTLIYRINKTIFLISLYLVAVMNLRLTRADLIHRAINDGETMAASPE